MRLLHALPVVVAALPFPSPAYASRCADVGPRQLTLHMVNRARLPPTAEATLMTEVTRIWRSAGVAVQWRPAPSGEIEAEGDGVYVIVVPEAQGVVSDQNVAGEGLALIRFSNGRAHRHIYASVGATTRVMSGDKDRLRLDATRSRIVQQQIARALGRAVAHEVGHYLANSPDHAPRGLMRASHRITDLIAPDRGAFQVERRIDESGSCSR
jgi:hypothetical protein